MTLNKYIFISFILLFFLYYSHIFKYQSFNYNHADSAVYNQVLNSIIYNATTGSSLEENGEFSTFRVHFSPIFFLLAPFKIIFFSEFFPEVVQSFSFFLSILILIKIFPQLGVYWFIITLGILMLPQIFGLFFTSFRAIKLSLPFILFAIYFLRLNKFKLFLLSIILCLSLIETNISIAVSFFIMCLSVKNRKKCLFALCIISLAYILISFNFVDYSRHSSLSGLNFHRISSSIKFFFPLFLVFIFLNFFSKNAAIYFPILFFIIWGGISDFFNFGKKELIPAINCYYVIPLIPFLLYYFTKKFRIAKIYFFNKIIFILPLLFVILSFFYGLQEKNKLFSFLNNSKHFDFKTIQQAKKMIPFNSILLTSYRFTDIFSEYSKLHFFNFSLKKNIFYPQNINEYCFIDINEELPGMLSTIEKDAFTNSKNLNKILLFGNYEIIKKFDNYILLRKIK